MSHSKRTFLKVAGLGLTAAPLLGASPLSAQTRVTTVSGVRLNVRDFGAVGDSVTKDTLALQQALDRCAVLGGGEVLVPAGIYLTGAIRIGNRTVLRLDAAATLQGSPDLTDYPLAQVRWEGKWIKGHIGLISAKDADDIGISGKGKILASLDIKGRVNKETGVRHAALIEFVDCKRVVVEDVFTSQNDMWSIHLVYCEDIVFRRMTVNGRADGIDVDSCKRVVIEDCDFDTYDDCISLKSGRGMEGNTIGRPTEDVRISRCTFRDLHWACIGIGSETSGGIRKVRVDNCKCLSAKTFAIYIKSRPGRGAFIEDIRMDHLDVSGAGQGFLRFNFLDSGKQDEVPVPGLGGIPTVRDLHFSHIRVENVPMLVDGGNIHPDKPLDGFSLTDVSGTCGKGMVLRNIRRANLKNIKVTGYAGPLLSTHNVNGSGLDGAVPTPAVQPAAPIAPPVPSYVLK
ncbi:glycoside hydrolase family 28 protein [Asticcacaulis sp. YBE204]|uniref:glycoside hydrolase family 28 protein n=1 Tax=Asticcacaulis sp. YBE204 TaxID=1282363 RepID=UPI0003C400A7|nr:glycosyl hydrolase family 28 protein [Asticcacaulis sp. YBE204]ESQ78997.1 hypothetical protein AEYBE204_11275 [Asticcacaulis sp. YBE204]